MSEGKDDVEKALALLLEAYKSDSSDFSVNNNLGTAYMLKEDYTAAEQYYKAALAISPDDEDALFNLANALVKAGKPAEAEAENVPVLIIITRCVCFYYRRSSGGAGVRPHSHTAEGGAGGGA